MKGFQKNEWEVSSRRKTKKAVNKDTPVLKGKVLFDMSDD